MARKISVFLLITLLVAQLMGALTVATASNAPVFTEEELAASDYTLYFVNAGAQGNALTTLASGDKMGLYQERTDQAYAKGKYDDVSWGYTNATGATSAGGTTTSLIKTDSVRYFSGTSTNSNKSVYYKFDLPVAGTYFVTMGTKGPWSGSREMNLYVEGGKVETVTISQGGLVENTYLANVTDGALDVEIKGPASGTLNNYNDPMISYILVQKALPISVLEAAILETEREIQKQENGLPYYKPDSIAKANAAVAAVKSFYESNKDANVETLEIQKGIKNQFGALEAAKALLIPALQTEFYPGQKWYDTDGNVIDAHGMGIMWDERQQKYYWYGEYHKGTYPAVGVSCYSSTDLLNWKFESVALQLIPSMNSFNDGGYFESLYGDLTPAEQRAIWQGTPGSMGNAGIRVGRIPERPKVVYNEATGKYVLWTHIEGYDNASGTPQTGYGRAEAGVALSDSPTGPFKWISSYRMDRCPDLPGHVDSNPTEAAKGNVGYARDMNLYVDDDGTGYLIYSSEENRTMYISKLLPDYTDIAGWHKDDATLEDLDYVSRTGRPRPRDTEYQSEYGTDYIRLWQGLQHEAPAIFKYQDTYYLVTSGATGWSPNPGMYDTAPSMLGPWTATSVNPFVGTSTGSNNGTPATSFNSQPSCVIPVDAAAGKFIYCGDRWNGGNFANDAATYVFLPIEFVNDGEIVIRWMSTWTKDDLEDKGLIKVHTQLPETIDLGQLPNLPSTLSIQKYGEDASDVAVTWVTGSDAHAITIADFEVPGPIVLTAKLPVDKGGRSIDFRFLIIPKNTVYFVSAAGHKTDDYLLYSSYMRRTLKNYGVPEQGYPTNGSADWGYFGRVNGTRLTTSNYGTGTNGSAAGTIYSTIRYLNNGNAVATNADLVYTFNNKALPAGSYNVYIGFYDPWSNSTRRVDVVMNGIKQGSTLNYSDVNGKARSFKNIQVANNGLEIAIRNASSNGQDPMVAWIMIIANDLPANNAPVMKADIPVQSVAAGDSVTLRPGDIAIDADNDTLYFTSVVENPNPAVATVVVTEDGLTITGNAPGSTSVVVKVSDGEDAVAVTVPITVPAAIELSVDKAAAILTAGYAANIPVAVTVPEEYVGLTVYAALCDPTGAVVASAPVENGSAVIRTEKLPDTGKDEVYTVKALIEGQEPTGVGDTVTVLTLQSIDLWKPAVITAGADGDKRIEAVQFGGKISLLDKGSVTLRTAGESQAISMEAITVSENTILFQTPLAYGETLIISGLKYYEMFPSYSFTFTIVLP